MINEEKAPNGLKITQDAQKQSKKESDAYYTSVKKKVDSVYGKDVKPEVEPNKYNYSDDAKKIHDELETLNGLEMIEYDQEPDENFKKRAKAAIEGDSTMGNPSEEGGNTDPVWKSHDKDFGKNLIKRSDASKKKRDDAKVNYVALGDDMELSKDQKTKNIKNLAFENYSHYFVTNNKIVKGLKVESNSTLKESVSEVLKGIKDRLNETSKVYNRSQLRAMGIDCNSSSSWEGNYIYEDVSYEDLVSLKESKIQEFDETTRMIAESNLDKNSTFEITSKTQDAKERVIKEFDNAIQAKRDVMKENNEYPPEYTHFTIHKPTGTILLANDYSDVKDYEGKFDNQSIKEYVLTDLEDNFGDEIPKRDIKILTRKAAERQGIDLNQSNSYYAYSQSQQGINEGKIKSLKFKKHFGGIKKALTLIPESYKVNMRKFEMTDGNEKYLIRWEGNLNEGHAVVLNSENANQIQESYDKVKHLIAFNGLDSSRTTAKDRSKEEEFFKYNLSNIKQAVLESNKPKGELIKESVSEKQIKEKFAVRQIDLNETTSKYAKVTKAKYLKEGGSYEGVVYHIELKESIIPVKLLAKEIVAENKHKKPADRFIKFKFNTDKGNEFEM